MRSAIYNITLTYGQLHELMIALGYKATKTPEGWLVYTHDLQDSLFPIRQRDSNVVVPEIVLSAIATNVINTMVAPEEKFRRLAAAYAA